MGRANLWATVVQGGGRWLGWRAVAMVVQAVVSDAVILHGPSCPKDSRFVFTADVM